MDKYTLLVVRIDNAIYELEKQIEKCNETLKFDSNNDPCTALKDGLELGLNLLKGLK